MKRSHLLIAAAAAALLCAQPSFAAGPPAGVPMGPPAGVTMGPPAGIPAGPPSVPMGPPAGIPSGPPSGITPGAPDVASSHIPDTTGPGTDTSVASAANLLGNLNAAHASEQGLTHASSNSIVGAIELYKTTVSAAQANIATDTQAVATDTTNLQTAQQTLQTYCDGAAAGTCDAGSTDATYLADQQAVTDAQNQLNTDQASLDAANQSVTDAENTLAQSANKPLTSDVIAQLNTMLGL